MATKYQPLVDYIAAEAEGAVTLSFAEIETILGFPLPETVQIEAAHWRHSRTALGWGLHARGWTAMLDRLNRCVVFTRNQEQ